MSTSVAGNIAAVRVKTGQYTGDGAVSQAITGIGFQPKMVHIWPHFTDPTDNVPIFIKIDQMFGNFCWYAQGGVTIGALWGSRLISLDGDGFTVGDVGTDDHPNKSDQLYDYIALG